MVINVSWGGDNPIRITNQTALSELTTLSNSVLKINFCDMPYRVSFRYFKTSPEIIQLAVMLYVRFPLSLRNVEDLLHERGVDVSALSE